MKTLWLMVAAVAMVGAAACGASRSEPAARPAVVLQYDAPEIVIRATRSDSAQQVPAAAAVAPGAHAPVLYWEPAEITVVAPRATAPARAPNS